MPAVASLDALERAAADFEIGETRLVIEPAALTEVRRSLDSSGLLLLGEVHGVRENPLVIRALMVALGVTGLALEWAEQLAPAVGGYLAGRPLADDMALWSGDGRITAGHLAVIRERAAAGPLDLTLFDGIGEIGWTWSQRDEAMAERLLARVTAASGTLAVAGNAHTPTGPTSLGLPLGAQVARQRPGVRSVRIKYGGGRFYNCEPRRFRPRANVWRSQVRLRRQRGHLVLDLPGPTEATVPQRPWERTRALPLELSDQGGRGACQPAVGERLTQRPGGDLRQLDQHGRVAVEVRDGEERVRVGREHRLLLAEVLDLDGEDRAVRRCLLAEPADVRLAERPVPGEGLAADIPGPVAVPLPLGDLGQLSGHPGHVIQRRHVATLPRALQPGDWH